MLGSDVRFLREQLKLSEEELAKRIGLPLARYLAIEAGNDRVTRLHTLAFERLALSIATERKEPELAPPSVKRVALRYAAIVLEQNRPAAD